jgi:ribokinase
VAVVGSVNTDLVVRTPRLPAPGQTVAGSDLSTGGGGKGANQAVAAARLGAAVRFLGRVGDDAFGQAARASLAADGVDVAALLTTPGRPSGVALIVVDARGQNQIAVAPGANAGLSVDDVESAFPRLRECAVLLLQLEVPIEATTRAARLAHEAGLLVILNPAPAPAGPLPPELLAAVGLIVPNEHEAAALTGRPAVDRASADAAARQLVELGPASAIVTLGDQGALVLEGGAATHLPAPSVDAVDTTAAGDAFCGGLAVALARGQDLVAAARFASRVAGLAVTRPGAQASMPTLADVEARP